MTPIEEVRFVIRGNQENPDGNPVPYVRSTQRGQFKPTVMRYNMWKHHVIKVFYDSHPRYFPRVGGAPVYSGKIFNSSKNLKFKVGLFIHWGSDNHADPDNIYKGIVDALFKNDKHVAIKEVDYDYSPDKKGSVEIVIEIIPMKY